MVRHDRRACGYRTWLATAAVAVALRISLPAAQSLPFLNTPEATKFAVIGDMGTGKPAQYQVAEELLRQRTGFPFNFVLMLGDNLYGRQRPQDIVRKFDRPYEPLIAVGVRFYASLGNHDQQANRFYPPWNMDGRRYYSFVRGTVRFFALDSTKLDDRQLAWLEMQLQQSDERWKVVFFHHPLYSSASRHGSQLDARRRLEPLFVRYGVNVVFSGHDHVYERLRPQQGIYYFVSGAGGQLRKGNLRKTTLTAVGYDQDQSFMLVEIDGDRLAFAAISRTGLVVDRGSLPRQVTSPGGDTHR